MKPTIFELIVLSTAAGIIGFYTFIPPIVGIADNGDFERVLAWRGLRQVSNVYYEKYFRYVNSKYLLLQDVPKGDWYLTSSSLLIIPAVRLGRLLGDHQTFDIRIFAAVQIVLYLIGIWLILVGTRVLGKRIRLVLSILLVLILSDVGYVSYFNSFYAEGTALVFLTIAIGCALILISRQPSNVGFAAIYFVSVAMLITSKPMYVPYAPILGLFGMYLCRGLRFNRKYAIAGGFTLLLCVLGFWYFKKTTSLYVDQSSYVALFLDLLPHSNTPREDLTELGLNPNYEVYSGTSPYQADSPFRTSPEFLEEFKQNIKSSTVPWFYLSRPKRLYQLWDRCSKLAFTTRVDSYGYYEASAGKPLFVKPFGLWSLIREHSFPRSILFLMGFFLTGLLALFWAWQPAYRSVLLLYAVFVFISASQFFIATLGGGGEADLIKHLFMFNLSFDLAMLVVAFSGLQLLMKSNVLNRRRSPTLSR